MDYACHRESWLWTERQGSLVVWTSPMKSFKRHVKGVALHSVFNEEPVQRIKHQKMCLWQSALWSNSLLHSALAREHWGEVCLISCNNQAWRSLRYGSQWLGINPIVGGHSFWPPADGSGHVFQLWLFGPLVAVRNPGRPSDTDSIWQSLLLEVSDAHDFNWAGRGRLSNCCWWPWLPSFLQEYNRFCKQANYLEGGNYANDLVSGFVSLTPNHCSL